MENPKLKKPNLKTPKIILKPNQKPKPTAKAKARANKKYVSEVREIFGDLNLKSCLKRVS